MTHDDRLFVEFIVAMSLAAAILVVGWFDTPRTPRPAAAEPYAVGTSGVGGRAAGKPRTSGSVDASAADVEDLRTENPQVPIDGTQVARWKGSFAEARTGHAHEAVDILAPRNTPIHAVADGRIAKLFVSKAGGITIYQRDPTGRFIFYYAHLQRYADELREGDTVSRGDIIGYVGTSGNAPPDTPHLHFAIFRVADPKRWWEGAAIDPYLVYSGGQE